MSERLGSLAGMFRVSVTGLSIFQTEPDINPYQRDNSLFLPSRRGALVSAYYEIMQMDAPSSATGELIRRAAVTRDAINP